MAPDGTQHFGSITSVSIEKCTDLIMTMKTPSEKPWPLKKDLDRLMPMRN